MLLPVKNFINLYKKKNEEEEFLFYIFFFIIYNPRTVSSSGHKILKKNKIKIRLDMRRGERRERLRILVDKPHNIKDMCP